MGILRGDPLCDRLDDMELSAKNRILCRPDDLGCASDALMLVRWVRRMMARIEDQTSEIAKLKAQLAVARQPVAYGRCEHHDCERATAIGSRFCDIHLAEVAGGAWRRGAGKDAGPPAVARRKLDLCPGGRLKRSHPPDGESSPSWEDAVAAIEEG